MIERDLRSYLSGFTAVRDASPGGIWPGKSPRNHKGARIILREISTTRTYSIGNESGLSEKIVQVDSYAETPAKAEEMFQAVRNVLSGYSGLAGDSEIQGTRIVSEGTMDEPPENESDVWTHRYRADFALYYPQAVPTQ